MKKHARTLLAAGLAATWVLLVACAPASLGSPPAGEQSLKCRTGETIVCRTHDVGRVGDEEEREYDWCTCESLDHGLRL